MTASEHYEIAQRDGAFVKRKVTVEDWEPINDEVMQANLTEMDRRILRNLNND